MRKLFLSMLAFGIALAGCGSDEPYGVGPSPDVTQISVSSSVASIPSDGSAAATITAFARDASNNLVANVPITFTATSGGLAAPTASTNANGEATVTLNTAGDSAPRTIIITARSGALAATTTVTVVQGGNQPLSVSMGSFAGGAFQTGILAIAPASIAAGGNASIEASLRQSDGSLYTSSASVSFSSTCISQGLASVTTPVVTTSGTASTTYMATGCSGTDVVTASATVNGTALSATGSVTVAPSTIGSIVFVTATPENLALRGTGTTTHPETSTLVFRVVDQEDNPRAGATVNFSLNTTVGGISLAPASAVSDSQGRVQTVVQGGTVATSVRVTATVQGVTPALATQSNQLTVTTGIPDQDSFSLAVDCPNVPAWNRDGEVVEVTARLSDRFNNPVPEDTAVTFQAEGGSIASQCTTTGASGSCSVNWTSSNPRPQAHANGNTRAGRATILATAIGEESFSDTNGNGAFDNGETKVDLPERFLDHNENDVRDPTEPFYDFNSNATYDGADGFFNGVLCQNTLGECSATAITTGIATDNVIIMSDSVPTGIVPSPVDPDPAVRTLEVTRGTTTAFSFRIADLNDNPMPSGTTVQYEISGTGLTRGGADTHTVPCTYTATDAAITISATPTATDGTLTLIVSAPQGTGQTRIETTLVYAIDAQ